MLTQRLSEVALWTRATLYGADQALRGVSTDTRTLTPGALFVALKGERYDAHEFVVQARAAGAVAALVSRRVPVELPQILVADTLIALGDMASAVRAQRRARVVGITGSNGKTTVKTLVTAILALHARTHVNAGNFNNEIGLPLSVLALPEDAEFAVFEMGAGKPGDIAYLAAIARPEIGLVNNIAPAHLERMGNLEGVAETKGAMYSALPAHGTAVINADDAFAERFVGLAGSRRVLRFGLEHAAEVHGRVHELGAVSKFTLTTPVGNTQIALPLVGRHNVLNALAAAAIASALDVPLATIHRGLERAAPVKGRLVRHASRAGWSVIDDSYNANPGSTSAAIAVLTQEPGEAWLALGDMAELGGAAERLHAEIGALARTSGVRRLFAVGPLSRAAVAAFGAGALHYPDQGALAAAIKAEIRPGVRVLVKGSRSAAMERVVAALIAGADGNGGGARHAA